MSSSAASHPSLILFLQFTSLPQTHQLLRITVSSEYLHYDTLIGSDAHGAVYRTYWEKRRVAAKKVQVTQDEVRHVTDIQNEIDILQKLKHRHIIQFFDTTYHENMLVLIMDYAEGGSLSQAIEDGRVAEWETKTRIAQEIVRGLDYIHYKGILHRDLKSHNVLLTGLMEVKLCDFGLATVKVRSASQSTEQSVGTFRWMAPELLGARPKYSTKSDMYSLGMVMWEIAANCTVPFKDQPDIHIVINIVMRGERELLPDDVPMEYSQWVQRCWEHDPENRPEANEMVTEDEDQVFSLQTGLKTVSVTNTTTSYGSTMSLRFSRSTQAMGGMSDHSLEGVSVLLSRANIGEVEAQVALAEIYEEGRVTEQNNAEAFKWYLRAAVQGSTEAQVKVGTYILNGNGTGVNHGAAIYWTRRAAMKGDLRAQCVLGSMYENGRGAKQDYVEAISWYRKSADQGYAVAQCNLGLMYHHGNGVKQDYVEAVSWYRKSADQGYATAQCNLGLMYENGWGVKQDNVEAMSWYHKASLQGNARAQQRISGMNDSRRSILIAFGRLFGSENK
ncbi:hypothetical protein BGW41_005144 [Actinomortierella wolfii]|nr:hypothetical protein BGW41_005144 [Actinomortierella wolfii]